MANQLFSQENQFDDDNGTPLSGGSLVFVLAGTSTPATVYSDDSLSTSLGSTVSLNSAGRPDNGGSPVEVYGALTYDVEVRNASDVAVYTIKNKAAPTTFAGLTLTAQLLLDDSTSATVPVLAFSNDTNTGFGHPSADVLTAILDGTEAFRVTSAGRLGIGTTTPSSFSLLDVAGDLYADGARIDQDAGTYSGAYFEVLDGQDRGLLYTGTNTAREPVLWARTDGANIIAQMNVTADGWEWGEGSSVDATPAMTLDTGTGALSITGAISKGSGTFRIPHPIREGHDLVHSFVEGPRADLIYRGTATLEAGVATVDLDAACGLTPGTFAALCRDPQVWVQSQGFTAVRGSVSGAVLSIEAQDSVAEVVSWLVVAERQDEVIRAAEWTDDEGRPVLEPARP